MKENINKELVVKSKIDKNKLNKYQYTNSLIEEAVRIKLLDTTDMSNIQNQLINCLAELIMQKTNGESTSLSADETKNLMNSIIYTLDIYFESISNPDDVVYQLKTQKIGDLIQRGTDIIENMYNDVMDFYLYIVKKKLKVPLDCYNTTIDEGIPIFLKFYNMVFSAHVASTTIDYPLAIDDWDVRGVKYMHTYLKRCSLETNFCKIFGDEKIEKLLYYFGKKIGMDYKVELINIFELTYHNAVFMLLAGSKVLDLILTPYSSKIVIERLEKLNNTEMETTIREATHRLLTELNITDETTIDYIFKYLPNFIHRLNNNRENQSLDSMLIAEVEEKVKEKFCMFQSREAMNEKNFRKVVNTINNIYDAEEKANYIISNITSLYDFMDILNSDYLYESEYEVLFSKLSDFELTILVKVVYYEDIRDKTESMYEIVNKNVMYDYEWQTVFNEFLKNLKRKRLDDIEKYIDEIDYEQLKFN